MTIFHDMLCQPTSGELRLRHSLEAARQHAEDLEEALLKPDPDEFTNPSVHVEICFERQKAAHAWRKAGTLQSELNGAENRRYSRCLAGWLVVGFGSQLIFPGGFTLTNVVTLLKLLGGHG